ncbi:TetR/AcrR family transcriptional regulator [Nocardioides sp. zg-1308]|jgi:AcrR family transcriptional regulator|uniref:TetR/AcrR family transcriptional regulator n=1 Tax=Nocardioides renjunii TaxID=3095075 RepID=A0ABU5KF72_9ACTN|nr:MULTISPECIES: TetR/AcrR family transcriptional regulator [unclassified Nocardioides]MDZ5663614.1 TetR/AcrR family transcriptional regulator [Nocardioides sp. S-58]NPD06955.1 TetR/AcrR family transcriptional regulator [Nocardioides sp. zg-1308]WQQ20698.1 TetR/AcrR family transcriptional regulator [Nocardioides sp. S-34]
MSSESAPAAVPARTGTAAARRRRRETEIISATRRLFDERGVRDAQIEDIARSVGINRAIIYRHFTGKEELFSLTLVQYLDELRVALEQAASTTDEPRAQLERLVGAFVDYGLAHPAFVDCAQAIMRRPGGDLLEEVSESAMYRLGQAITGCLSVLTRTIEAGAATGDFHVEDPGLLANMLYASGLGTLQLGRVALLVSEEAPGVPRISRVTGEQVRDHMVASALAVAAGAPR